MGRPAALLLGVMFWLSGGPLFGQIEPPVPPTKNYRPYPQPDAGYVTDLADVLSDDEEERIEHWLRDAETESGVEIVVVTIDSIGDFPGTSNGSVESFATALFDTYGIGNLPRNDGVLLLVAVKERKARIEFGKAYGHARDAEAERIMQKTIIPRFKRNDYAGGITDGVRGIMREFAGMETGLPVRLIVGFGAPIAFVLIGISLILNGRKGWGWVFVGLGLVMVIFVFFALFSVLSVARSALGSGESSSGWSPGGSGGFGGGSSGGGGATGSW